MFNIKDLCSLKNLNGKIKDELDIYFNEALAFRVKAEKGWKAIYFIPIQNSNEIIIDIVPVEEWGYFTSLQFIPTIEEYDKNIFLKKQQEVTLPIFPINYTGVLSSYIKSIEELYPEWNRIMPSSLLFGCIAINDKRSREEIEKASRDMYYLSMKKIENYTKTKETLTTSLEKIYGSNVNKDKLN